MPWSVLGKDGEPAAQAPQAPPACGCGLNPLPLVSSFASEQLGGVGTEAERPVTTRWSGPCARRPPAGVGTEAARPATTCWSGHRGRVPGDRPLEWPQRPRARPLPAGVGTEAMWLATACWSGHRGHVHSDRLLEWAQSPRAWQLPTRVGTEAVRPAAPAPHTVPCGQCWPQGQFLMGAHTFLSAWESQGTPVRAPGLWSGAPTWGLQ